MAGQSLAIQLANLLTKRISLGAGGTERVRLEGRHLDELATYCSVRIGLTMSMTAYKLLDLRRPQTRLNKAAIFNQTRSNILIRD